MRVRVVILLFLALTTFSCLDNIGVKSNSKWVESKKDVGRDLKYWTWMTADADRDSGSYIAEFKKYKRYGLDAVLINTNADPALLERLAPLAKAEGLEVHAWLMAMNRPGDMVALQHPEWYVVSRDGKSAFDHRPYVDYYEFLCPTREGSRNHVLDLVKGLSRIEDVAGIHLDYIRFPDVYLPIALLPKYDLVQNEELPQFDFCYCDVCIDEFQKAHHKNPREMKAPAIDMEWKQFRLDKIREVVEDAYGIAHEYDKLLTAAVFPYPEMADHMVRQRWDKWKVDMVLPMIYNNFYNEGIDWIGFATKQGVQDLKTTGIQLHTGIYVPEMSGEELTEAIEQAKMNGAKGVSFFDGPALTVDHLKAIKASK